MRDNKVLQKLNSFLGRAAGNTYAGGGQEVDPEEARFKELEFHEGDWHYKDSYAGFFQSWGREVVWLNKKPFWMQIYGGGMTEKFQNDIKLAHETFDFLKKALSAGEKQEAFQPRGPKNFSDDEWEYSCEWSGDITKFEGHEKILFKKEVVFTHDFLGGLVLAR
ncbi:hypothetical protein KKF59_01700 [Patescibacteria group bacterium]|nr:hypothetical protein [Patescibacteria group bacterium]MBU1034462.1 hypothetical protein [Patescibacteria group bacterium]MBU1629904.1 hypothetical protein [Patescibacteria group bacterium]MBU1907828.1 hypothetical protein [Patescibacteria group bacterium]